MRDVITDLSSVDCSIRLKCVLYDMLIFTLSQLLLTHRHQHVYHIKYEKKKNKLRSFYSIQTLMRNVHSPLKIMVQKFVMIIISSNNATHHNMRYKCFLSQITFELGSKKPVGTSSDENWPVATAILWYDEYLCACVVSRHKTIHSYCFITSVFSIFKYKVVMSA